MRLVTITIDYHGSRTRHNQQLSSTKAHKKTQNYHVNEFLAWLSSKQIFQMSRRKVLASAVRTFTRLSKPVVPVNISSITALGHALCFVWAFMTKTKSPRFKFGEVANHFCLGCKSGRYSSIHLRQNSSARN